MPCVRGGYIIRQIGPIRPILPSVRAAVARRAVCSGEGGGEKTRGPLSMTLSGPQNAIIRCRGKNLLPLADDETATYDERADEQAET